MNMISKEEYKASRFEKYDADCQAWEKDLKALEDGIIEAVKSGDEYMRHIKLNRYAFIYSHDKPAFPNKGWEETYDECEKVARVCNVNFETEWVDNQTVLVKGPFKSLSAACKIIASLAELHSGMFSFESSFSEHEAYTKSGHRITISGYDDRVVKVSLKLVK